MAATTVVFQHTGRGQLVVRTGMLITQDDQQKPEMVKHRFLVMCLASIAVANVICTLALQSPLLFSLNALTVITTYSDELPELV